MSFGKKNSSMENKGKDKYEDIKTTINDKLFTLIGKNNAMKDKVII